MTASMDNCKPPFGRGAEGPSFINHVFALRRSGHHAVLGWLRACYEFAGFATDFINEVLGPSDALSSQPESATEFCHRWLTGSEVLATSKNGAALFLNYEDVAYTNRMVSSVYTELFQDAVAPSRNIVVVRDYYNLLASRLAMAEKWHGTKIFPSDWIDPTELAQAWQGDVQFLHSDKSGDQPLCVSFNEWFSNFSYRARVAGDLGLTSCEAEAEVVRDYGFGSSFDGQKYDGSASRMNVSARWMDLPSTLIPVFRNILHGVDGRIRELNSALFGIHYSDVLEAIS